MNCLDPFKGWCQENFPFIEDDFDAITDYQLMCKLKEYVVKMGNDVANLETNYNTLIDQVNELETVINSMAGDVNDLKDEFASLKTLVESYNMRIIANSNRIEQVNVNLLNTISMTADDLRDYTDTKVANLKTYVDLQDGDIITRINNLKTYVDLQDTYILTQVENIYGALPKVRFTGTSINAENTIEAPMPIKLNSNTSQETTTGKNKINYKTVESKGGTTITLIQNGFNANGSYAGAITVSNLKANTDYYLSFDREVISGTTQTITIFAGTTQTTTLRSLTGNGTFNTGNNTTINIWFYCGAGTQGEQNFTYIQLEEGTSKTSYEPYTNGVASPSPEYEQPIHRVTGNNTLTINNNDIVVPLGDIEYCVIGDYADVIFKSVEGDPVYDSLTSEVKATLTDDKWYIQKNVKSKNSLLSDYRDIVTTYSNLDYVRIYKPSDSANYGNSNDIAVKMTTGSYAKITNFNLVENIAKITSSGGLNDFWYGVTKGTTEQQAQTILTNSKLYYPLATSDYILLNDTLQEVIESIYNEQKSNNGTTTITQTNADLPFIIEAIMIKKGEITDEV